MLNFALRLGLSMTYICFSSSPVVIFTFTRLISFSSFMVSYNFTVFSCFIVSFSYI